MVASMNVVLTYRGRRVTEADVAFLRKLIADNPAMNRRALSVEVCRAWDWRQPNGVLKEGICRSLMLQLHRAGHLELPPPRARYDHRVRRCGLRCGRCSRFHFNRCGGPSRSPYSTPCCTNTTSWGTPSRSASS